MAKCKNCGTEFSFLNLLKSATPWTIKCSSCSQPIKTGTISTILVVLSLTIICLALYIVLMAMGLNPVVTIGCLFLVTLIVEYIWYKLIVSGSFKSNLIIE